MREPERGAQRIERRREKASVGHSQRLVKRRPCVCVAKMLFCVVPVLRCAR